MIQKIINGEKYLFHGTLKDLKRCISSFKVTKVLNDSKIQDIEILEVMGKFKYHGDVHKIHIYKDWCKDDVLHIEYYGKEKSNG